MQYFRPLFIALTYLVSSSFSMPAQAYSAITFSINTDMPALQALSANLAFTQGSAQLNLIFAYNTNNAGFSCTNSSAFDNQPVTCVGTQKLQGYAITITNPATNEKISLKGTPSANRAKATYKGVRGKLLQTDVAVTIQQTSSVTSNVTLTPSVDNKGRLSGGASLVSGYGGSPQTAALSGTLNAKSHKLNWRLKYAADKLTFNGTEQQGAWNGKLIGNIGPAKISQTLSIPLSSSAALSRFHGTVSGSDTSGNQPLADVAVVIRSDVDNNGQLTGDETQTVTTDSNGKFDVQFATQAGRAVTVDFNLAGYSQTPKMFASINPGADVPVSTSLRKLDDLTIAQGNATTTDNKLQLNNLPSNIYEIQGKVFNPVTEAAQFPGEFADNSGNLLISSVFSNVQAQNAQGEKVTELANDTQLRMLVPSETWSTMRDLTPGNNQIDVPLYYYDEKDGQWKRSTSNGWLENEAGNKLAENQLASLQNGSYSGSLYAVGNITHLSYWNIDWPVDTHQCVCGRVIDSNGQPVAGALVTAKGVSYSGSSAPITTGSDGRFCIDVMRSEAAGEDLDGDGILSEQQTVVVTISYDGKYYKLPDSVMPAIAASGSSNCLQLGDVTLNSNIEVTTSFCNIAGQTLYSGTWNGADPGISAGAPLANTMVVGFDSSSEDLWQQCLQNECVLYAMTDSNGHFNLKVPMLLGAELFGWSYSQPNANTYQWFYGNLTLTSCPATPITLQLDASNYTFPQ